VVAARQQQALEHIRRFGVVDPFIIRQTRRTTRAATDERPRNL
jgi:hypothetical protein